MGVSKVTRNKDLKFMMSFISSRLLIVEDDLNTLSGLQELLREEGFYVHGVNNGRKALEAVNRESFDIVLCDYCLPGMDGQELCRELKRLQPSLALFLVTAYHHAELDRTVKQYGIEKVIDKPIIFSELLDTLLSAAAKSRRRFIYRINEKVDVPAAVSIFA
jgi:CheY-like chemotaxis protein